MLDTFIKMAKDELLPMINPEVEIDESKVSESIEIAGSSVKEGIEKDIVKNQGSNLLSFLNKKENKPEETDLFSNLTEGAISKLTSKLGLSGPIASMISNAVVSFILQKIFAKFGGEGSQGLASIVSGLNLSNIDLGKISSSLGDTGKGLDDLKKLF